MKESEEKKYKKHLLFIPILVMGLTILFLTDGIKNVSAAIPTEERHFTYTVASGKATITNYKGNLEGVYDVVIPSTLGGFPTTVIGSLAMRNKGLTSVVIPDGVTTINGYAFNNNKLSEIIIPESVIQIGDGAFKQNLLTTANIPVNTTKIGSYVFQNNRLMNVIIPNNVTEIGDGAFDYNNLTNIIIPDGVTKINNYAFSNNRLTDVVIPEAVTYIGNGAFLSNQLTEIIIPEGVTNIGDYAFAFNMLTNIIIPESLHTIGRFAFTYNQISNIDIPNSVTMIGEGAFGNNKLTEIILPNVLTTIGNDAFVNNQLENIVIPESVTSIGSYAFSRNKLTSVKFLSSNATLGTDLFSLNQTTPANLVIEGYSASTIETHASLKSFTFIVLQVDGTETGVMNVNVFPGVMALSSFPSTLSFESYELSIEKPLLKLQSPFELSIDDFTGSYAGWNLSISFAELVDGANELRNPSLLIDLTNLEINDADENGSKIGFDNSTVGTFTKTGGTATFGISKKILSGQINNPDATMRHYFNFPVESLQLSFDNTTKTGTFAGTTTFLLIASP